MKTYAMIPINFKYDENNNLISNNVTFKVYTSNSRVETSAKNLFEEITIDFSSLTMYADGGTSTVSGVRGNLETGLGAGWASGVLTGVSVGNDGKIYGDYDNGVKKLLGQIAVTSFANPTGLEAIGNSLFKTTVNSGEFDGVGSDIYTLGLSITSGALESSNVDLSNEFTNMITTQRGFEANSKIITTSDSMLDTLINLKR
jgi:flagellar hook protein FlgE